MQHDAFKKFSKDLQDVLSISGSFMNKQARKIPFTVDRKRKSSMSQANVGRQTKKAMVDTCSLHEYSVSNITNESPTTAESANSQLSSLPSVKVYPRERPPIIHCPPSASSVDQFSPQRRGWIQNWANPNAMTELNNVLKSRQAWDTIESHPNEPIGLLFVKLIQVTNKASSKLSDVEWSLRVNSVERTSYPTRSFKDNSGNTATMNEIFLFDVSEPFQLQMTVESSPVPTKFGTMAGLSNPQPSMLGQLELSFCLEQMEKSIRTYKLRPPTAEDSSKSSAKPDCEVVIMIGLHILEEPVLDRSWETEVLYQGFLTFMTRGSGLASWKRYWAVLEGRAVKLYDAEYQQKRDVIAVIPLVHILGVQPPDLDKVDVGANGFSMVVDPKGVDMNTLSCRADPSELDYSLYAFTDSAHLYKIWNAHLEDALDQYQENMIYQERIVKAKLARRASQSLSRHSFESSAPPSPLEMEGETLGTDLVDLKFVW